jgi:transcriptional regulator of acetoin/glycerol metabolism
MRSEIAPAAHTPASAVLPNGAPLRAAAAGTGGSTARHHADRVQAIVAGQAPMEDAADVWTSWNRCLSQHRIDPASKGLAHVLTSAELKDHREPIERMIQAAADELDRLHSIVKEGHYVVLLCDWSGVAVDDRVNAADSDDFKSWGFYPGGLWSEEMEGTNAIGTSIAEARAITVHGRQHFRTQYTSMSCSCAPIVDLDGRVIAVVNVTCLDPTISERSHALTRPLVSATARAIEKGLAGNAATTAWRPASVAQRGGLPPAALKRVRSYIQDHLAERVSIEQLAAVAGLSVFHFARAFKQSQGMTPHEYLVERRVAHAHALLKETDTPLSKIAFVSGFADQSHLARHFKRRIGVSPRIFRQSERYHTAPGLLPTPSLSRLAR